MVHCIQAKGSKSNREITIWDLFKTTEKKKLSLFQKLYNSFKKIKTSFKTYGVKIELITNRLPSSSKSKIPKDGTKAISFSFFIREIWRPFKNNNLKREMILEEIINQKFINIFSNHLKISEDELWEFFEHFNFSFNYKPKRVRNLEKFKKIEAYYNWYLITKKNPEKKGFFSIASLKKELKLSISPNPHDFPVDKKKYIQFPNLKNEIIERISNLKKGYLFLKGGPSTGKSTFLESEINNKTIQNCIVFKYLCFRDPNELSFRFRGEAVYFFEDLNEQFQSHIKGINIDDAGQRFKNNLKKLSKIAKEKGKKVLIIIDGIDHVTREEIDKLTQPLINILPKPSALPDNILFLIGGQHFDSILWYDSSKYKPYEMPHFTDKEIELYIKLHYNYDNTINFNILEKLFNKTQGNPRYLTLICAKFKTYEDLCKKSQLIDECLDFNDDWNDLYRRYWISFGFEKDNSFKEVTGLISRIYGTIDLMWLKSWSESIYIEQFISRFGFLFKRYSNVLLFEHDSFKTFLQKESITFAGVLDSRKEEEFYSELAKRCNKDSSSYAFWHKITYLKKARKIESFEYDSEYFISHWLQGRVLEDIIEDIRILLEYYVDCSNIKKSFEIMLLKLRFEMRDDITELDILINEVGTNLNYIFLLNPNLISIEYNLIFFCSNLLLSTDISTSFKISLIIYLKEKEILREDTPIFRLIRDYFKKDRQNWIETLFNPEIDKINTELWLRVNHIFIKDTGVIIKDYFRYLLAKNKEFLMQAGRWRYYPIVKAIGKYLIEKQIIKPLSIIYKILNDLIVKDEWELKDKEKLIFRNFENDEIYGNRYNENPLEILVRLKFDEWKTTQNQQFEEFLNENETYEILFESLGLKEIYEKYNDFKLSEEEIMSYLDGFIVFQSNFHLDAVVRDRIYIYKSLHDKFNYNGEKLYELFRRDYNTDLTIHSIRWQWELAFFNLFVNLGYPYRGIEQAKPLLESISDLFALIGDPKNYIDEKGIRILLDISKLLDNLVKRIKPYTFLYNWIQNRIFELFKQDTFKFNDIQIQLNLILSFQYHYNKVDLSVAKWVIENAKRNYSILNIGKYNLSSTIYKILKSLELLIKEEAVFYKENRDYFIDKLKIFGFRIYPSKGTQLYNFCTILLENIIKYFPPDDSTFINEISKVRDILKFAGKLTESSAILDTRKEFHDALISWNEGLAKKLNHRLEFYAYKTTDYSSNGKEELIEVDHNIIHELAKLLGDPQKFLSYIYNYYKKIRNKESLDNKTYSINIPKILIELEKNGNATLIKWENILKYLLTQDKLRNLSFIYTFFHFYKKMIKDLKSDNSSIKQLEIKIKQFEIMKEKARLPSPKYPLHPDTSLRTLFRLDKHECFEYGWELFQNIFIINHTKISHYKFRNFVMYTFLSRINKSNFIFFWDIYFKYLQDLFRLMEYLN